MGENKENVKICFHPVKRVDFFKSFGIMEKWSEGGRAKPHGILSDT